MNSFDSYVSQFTYPQEKDQETEKLRQQFLSRFPVSKLPTLTLQEYALGLEPKENSFCYWIEFKTRTLGGTGGGSSYKHVVFFRKKKQKWEYDPKFPNENAAFESVRNGLVTLVRLAEEGKYEELEDVEPFKGHNLTRGKILFLYYPDKFLPIFSLAHLRDLCQQLGITVDSDSQLAMNRALLAFKEAHSETKSWSNTKFMYFLYDKYSPTDQFWKIAPGENARFWEECRDGGFICIGFDAMGDLRQYQVEDDFKAEFSKHWPDKGGKWRELWNFANEVDRGDVVIANRGRTSIVGIGKSEGDYYFDSTRTEYKHCLKVNWENTQEQAISTNAHDVVGDWGLRTVKKITRQDFQKLFKGAPIVEGTTQTLQDSLKSVLALQVKWSADNTQPMQERGELIRNRIPALLEPLSQHYGLEVEGSDGSGNKNRVPWVRVYDPRFSPRPTDGWYVVLLFAADGSSVFLSLNQGTTKFVKGSSVPLDPELLQARVNEARSKLNSRNNSVAGLLQSIDLKDSGNKGGGYERGNAYATKYDADKIPQDSTILTDSSRLIDLLKVLYESAAPDESSRATYLLAWNPENWDWSNLPRMAMQFHSGEPIVANDDDGSWRVANKSVKPGDRLFLIRLGKEPKGIMGSGYSMSVPYQDAHYNGEAEKTTDYVKLRWDALLDPEHDKILSLAEIQQNIPDVHWTTQSSGILIPPDAHSKLEQMWKAHLSGLLRPPYTMDDALADVFLEPDFFADICELARRQKNIVLQGPPGVGKTFVAKRLAYALLGAKDDTRLKWVQFHQSYSYEDFILGFRPNGTGFELKEGIFYRFCEKASNDSRPHVFVIDEINRGNLSRIFGEALSVIEKDKRGELSVALAYGNTNPEISMATDFGKEWTIPPNLILIGLMNTADRSLAVVDYALRRRFAFIDLEPRFDSPKIDAVLEKRGISPTMRENIRRRLKTLNSRISSDKRNLGRGFEIGHSFFCPDETVGDEEQWFRSIIKYEIKPLLMEYWFDDQDTATREASRLLGDNPD